MSKLSEILRRIRGDHPKLPVLVELARAVTALNFNTATYLTLPILQRLAWKSDATRGSESMVGEAISFLAKPTQLGPPPLDEIYRWAEYLASERVGLFESHFELLRDDGSTVLLEDAAVAEALNTDKLFDPDTGELVERWRENVIVYYSVASDLDDPYPAIGAKNEPR